jgi:hypothetical protein
MLEAVADAGHPAHLPRHQFLLAELPAPPVGLRQAGATVDADDVVEFHAATAFVLAPFLATLAILGLAGHGLPRWLSYASAVLSLAFALGGAAALYWYGAFLGLLLWIVAVCVVAIAGEKLSAKAPETLTLLG